MGIDLTKHTESRWIRADDIGTAVNKVTIKDVTEELVRDFETREEVVKVAIWFTKTAKGMIPAKGNLRNLVAQLGTDTDEWVGAKCELYTEPTNMGPGTRLRVCGADVQPVVIPDEELTDEALAVTDDLPF